MNLKGIKSDNSYDLIGSSNYDASSLVSETTYDRTQNILRIKVSKSSAWNVKANSTFGGTITISATLS